MARTESSETFDGVVAVLRNKLRVQTPLAPETSLRRDLQFDSLQLLTLVVELENRFRLCFEPGDEVGLATLGDIAARIAALRTRGEG